jgi:penicillin amidase
LIEEVFGAGSDGCPGGLGAAVVAHLMDKTPFLAEMYWNVDQVLLSDRSPWFGGRSRTQIYRAALAKALRHPHGRDHDGHERGVRVVLKHILFGGMLPLRLGFDRGPIVLKGGRATVHQAQVYHNKGREVAFAPSYRFVADLATDDAHTTLPGGPSDRRFSKWYARGLLDWLHGRYRTLHGLAPAEEAEAE